MSKKSKKSDPIHEPTADEYLETELGMDEAERLDEEDYADSDECESEEESLGATTDIDYQMTYSENLQRRRERNKRCGMLGSATGIRQLDQSLGGLRGLVFLAGESQTETRSLALQFCRCALNADKELGCIYYSLGDMTRDEIFDCLICSEGHVDLRKYEREELSTEENERVSQANESLKDTICRRMRTFDMREMTERYAMNRVGMYGGLDEDILAHDCKRLMRGTGVESVLIVIDRFQNMPLPEYDPASPAAKDIHKAPENFRLRALSHFRAWTENNRPGGWPVLVMSEVRKNPGTSVRVLSPEDLIGPSAIRFQATQLLFVERVGTADVSTRAIPARVRIEKGSRTSDPITNLLYYPSEARFEESDSIAGPVPGHTDNRPRNDSRARGLDRSKAL